MFQIIREMLTLKQYNPIKYEILQWSCTSVTILIYCRYKTIVLDFHKLTNLFK